MVKSKEEILRALELCVNCTYDCSTCPYEDAAVATDYLCVDALLMDVRQVLQGARVLTLEEADEADVCWLELKGTDRIPPCRPVIWMDADKRANVSVRRFGGIMETGGAEEYRRTFRFWSERPTQAQREAIAWE